jgi:hypothetical protein
MGNLTPCAYFTTGFATLLMILTRTSLKIRLLPNQTTASFSPVRVLCRAFRLNKRFTRRELGACSGNLDRVDSAYDSADDGEASRRFSIDG